MSSPLYAPSTVRALLERHGLRADKGFGQNFLVDAHALAAVVSAAEIGGDDTVVEVGPGLGVLTRELAERAGRVLSLELDARLLPVLADTLAGRDNVEVRLQDALEFDFAGLPAGSLLVANLPYNVATPLLVRALEAGTFARLVVMVQKEVAERLCAPPGSDAFGSLSLIVAHFASARIVRHVSPGCFYPPPEVTSSVVRLDTRPGVAPAPELFALVRTAFRHRRKTLKRNLLMAGYERGQVDEALAALAIDPRARAETLGLDSFRRLLERLHASNRR